MPAGCQPVDIEIAPSVSQPSSMERPQPTKESPLSAMEQLLSLRPEQLTVEQFIDLTRLIASLRGQ